MTEDSTTNQVTPTRFKTLLVDPPWDHFQQGAKGAERHYKLMSLDRIKGMPVGDLAEDNAHLWLWVTNSSLRDGYDVAEAWGFVPKSILTWVKFRLGLGSTLRNASEHVLFCTRGKAPVKFKSQPTWFNAPVQEHSRKPDEIYPLIERLSDGPYLEIFARRRPPSNRGWSIWGNEVDSDLVIPNYPVPGDHRHAPTERGR